MWVLGNLAKIAITWQYRAVLEPPFAPKSFPVFSLYVHTNKSRMPFAPECFGAFQARVTFWAIFEKFFWSPLCTFLENAGFGLPCDNCHNFPIRTLLEPLFAPKYSPVFAL